MAKAETNEVKYKRNKCKICVSQYYMAIADGADRSFILYYSFGT